MSDGASQTFRNYQPSKTVWFWSCVAASILTIIVGFTWGGWVTGGTASENAKTASSDAVAELAASICVHRFLAAPDAAAKLATLKETDSWKRDSLVEEGGWVTFADMKKPISGASELCAEQLAKAELTAAADEIRQIEIAN